MASGGSAGAAMRASWVAGAVLAAVLPAAGAAAEDDFERLSQFAAAKIEGTQTETAVREGVATNIYVSEKFHRPDCAPALTHAKLIEQAGDDGAMTERWFGISCGQPFQYEVSILPIAGARSMFRVHPVGDAESGDAQAGDSAANDPVIEQSPNGNTEDL